MSVTASLREVCDALGGKPPVGQRYIYPSLCFQLLLAMVEVVVVVVIVVVVVVAEAVLGSGGVWRQTMWKAVGFPLHLLATLRCC